MEEDILNHSGSVFNPLKFPAIFSFPDRLVQPGSWVEHIPFAMFLIYILHPKRIVELGTHTGNSYCAFCQAIKEQGLDSECFAIDTWKGDIHSGFYGEEIWNDLKNYHDPLYGEFSKLIKSTFDQAVHLFDDGSIDLLHIDGLHTYEAVRHDFETWLPKVNSGGVILLHDTMVRDNNFGVWKFWEELRPEFPNFEFYHGSGLGVLVHGNEYSELLRIFFEKKQDHNELRNFFSFIGSRWDRELTMRTLFVELSQRDIAIDQCKAQSIILNEELLILNEELLECVTSGSWKFTRPIRRFNKWLQEYRNV
jgi:hypothetical protein